MQKGTSRELFETLTSGQSFPLQTYPLATSFFYCCCPVLPSFYRTPLVRLKSCSTNLELSLYYAVVASHAHLFLCVIMKMVKVGWMVHILVKIDWQFSGFLLIHHSCCCFSLWRRKTLWKYLSLEQCLEGKSTLTKRRQIRQAVISIQLSLGNEFRRKFHITTSSETSFHDSFMLPLLLSLRWLVSQAEKLLK